MDKYFEVHCRVFLVCDNNEINQFCDGWLVEFLDCGGDSCKVGAL